MALAHRRFTARLHGRYDMTGNGKDTSAPSFGAGASQSAQTNLESSGLAGGSAPAISLPKGGGAVRSMGEKFAANPVTGTGSMSIPIAMSPGRSGFGPQLALSYDSGAGNGPFGYGWSLALPSITRKTDKGLPRYLDAQASDVFILSGAEDLVPVLVRNDQSEWERERTTRTVGGRTYHVQRYRPRIEGLFARIERWSNVADAAEVFWRSIAKDNITSWYGRTDASRIADPEDPRRIFSWLLCQSHDDKGNVIVYDYQREDTARIFEGANERNRGAAAQRYPKRIRYGNRVPYFPVLDAAAWPAPESADAVDGSDAWCFEAVFDYGDHDSDAPLPSPTQPWLARVDPFSSYRATFEVRTYRRCERVLMFHHFLDAAGVGKNCLVRSTDFEYSNESEPASARNPVYTFLRCVTQTGYRRTGDGYDCRSLPPVELEYSEPVVQELIEAVDTTSLANLPIGLGSNYRWTDLQGEGIPGVLSEQVGAWFYKRNLSPLTNTAQLGPLEAVALRPNAALAAGAELMDLAGDGQPDLVIMEGPTPGLYEHDAAEGWRPFRAFSSRLNRAFRDPNLRFIDLDGDGHADVLITEDDAFVWHASLAEAGFGPAQRVTRALDEERGPRVVFADGTQSIYLADLSGDGLTDIVRIRNGEVCYWPNLGYGRFGPKVTMDNAPWFDHPDQFDHERIRLADIDGSGTTDILYLHRDGVRLYFNQSGNAWSQPQVLKVLPRSDALASIVPADLLGNGTACLVWSSPLPSDARSPLRYVNLMGGRKPHLLIKASNNLGAETRIEYAPSTKFYLQDKHAGHAWVTRLPFPVHVVERVETFDHVSRNRFVTRYAYHHGYFDGEEREFRGFGMVEQWDTEEFAALAAGRITAGNVAAASQVPPVHSKTWFHTGVYLGRELISRQFESEYFAAPGSGLLDDTTLPPGLTLEEEREACRALKGLMLRQEIYADDAGLGASPEQIERAGIPYTVTEQNFSIRTLQRRAANRHAVFLTHAREVLSYHYERNPIDPRLQHALTLEVDDYGNVLEQAAIGYGRHVSPLATQWDRERQTGTLITYTENRVTHAIDSLDAHRNPLPCEAVTFELTGYTATGAGGRFQASDLSGNVDAPEVAYEATAAGNQCRRRIEWLRTLYRRDDLTGLLLLGELQPLALPGESYKVAFTPGLLAGVFQRPHPGAATEALLPDATAVLGEGGYLQSQTLEADGRFPAGAADHWWIPTGRSFYSTNPADDAIAELAQARQHFFLSRRYRDVFGQDACVDFDRHDLLMTQTRDALGNRVTVSANDYRVLQPCLVSDPNRNQTEVAFDALGMVVGTAVMGKPQPAAAEGDSLSDFVSDLTPSQLDAFFNAADPRASAAALLKDASTRVLYDLDRFRRTRRASPNDPSKWQPVCAATLARETHAHSSPGSKIQVGFNYSDGFGREIQKKLQAEPGPVPQRDADGKIIVGANGQPVMTPHQVSPRWVGSGWTVFNNKGKPVRQYEPYFTDRHHFEFDVRVGVSAVLFYDAAERVIATLHPNGTFEKVVFDPWQQTTFDVNDTCAARGLITGDPRTDPHIGGYVAEYFKTLPAAWQTWHAQRIGSALGTDERNAAQRAAAHADTPTTAHFDALGRPFLVIARNRVVCPGHDLDGTEESFATRVELDIEGNQRAVRDAIQQAGDPLGRIVMRYAYDMLGNRIHQLSMEAGARWMLNDVAGKPIRSWDSRGHNFATRYDALRRPVEQTVRGTTVLSDPRTLNRDLLVDKIEYGEPPLDATAAQEANAQRLNLRTRIYRHFDSAGVVTNAQLDAAGNATEAYDFKGNLLRSTRRLVSSYTAIPDWLLDPPLEAETFEGSTRYDALNRPIQSVAPRSSLGRGKFNVIQPSYNEANLLERVDVWLERVAEPTAALDADTETPSPVGVVNIDYDAKGQRLRIDYENGASSFYSYDPLTFRLTQLLTKRKAVDFPGDEPQPAIAGWPGRQVQNLSYVYDAAGNISHIHDGAQQTIYFRNKRVEPSTDYVYDALYRLIQATGREHLGQGGAPIPHSHNDAGRVGLVSADAAGRFAPNDGNAMGRYIERYVYDAVGNFQQMQHRGSDPAHAGWTRGYDYLEESLIEDGSDGALLKTSNRLTRTTLSPSSNAPRPEAYRHDAHGSMVSMPHLGGGLPGPNLHCDYKDRLHQIDIGNGGAAWYVYDASGQRVRKLYEKAPGLTEERIYLGGFEIFRRHVAAIGIEALRLERETLHVMDSRRRVAIVETRVLDKSNDLSARQLIRYQFGNQLNSASLELSENAQVISYEEYAPYGSSTYQATRQIEATKQYRYTGKERDEESGLHYHGARYYAAWLGKWHSSDPEYLIDGPNLYQYTISNPIRNSDPTGTQSLEQGTADDPVVMGCAGGECYMNIRQSRLRELQQRDRVQQQLDTGAAIASNIFSGVFWAIATLLTDDPNRQAAAAQLGVATFGVAAASAGIAGGRAQVRTVAPAQPQRAVAAEVRADAPSGARPAARPVVAAAQSASAAAPAGTTPALPARTVAPTAAGAPSSTPRVAGSETAATLGATSSTRQQIDHRLRGQGNLRDAAREVHDLTHMSPSDITSTQRLRSPIARTQSTVGLVEVELPDGSRVVYGSASGGRLSPIQRRALQDYGVRIVGGTGHSEENLAAGLPEGSRAIRWGISWGGTQSPEPCSSICAPIVGRLGGVIER